jgi:hypothetical protein
MCQFNICQNLEAYLSIIAMAEITGHVQATTTILASDRACDSCNLGADGTEINLS